MSPDPSLFNLIAGSSHVSEQNIDALNFLNAQIEKSILSGMARPKLLIGVHKFSAVQWYQYQYSELAKQCESIVIFGESDAQPPAIANTEFIALNPGMSLANERFIIVNTPEWQVMLVARRLPETDRRMERQWRYECALTFAGQHIERCYMLATMLAGKPATPIGQVDALSQQQHIAQLVMQLVSTPELGDLSPILVEVPSLLDIAKKAHELDGLSERLQWLVERSQSLVKLDWVTVYRSEENALRPVASTAMLDQVKGVVMGQGLVGQVAQTRRHAAADATEAAKLASNLSSVYAMPIYAHDSDDLWGVVAFGSGSVGRFGSRTNVLPLATITGLIRGITMAGSDKTDSATNDMPLPPATGKLVDPDTAQQNGAARGRIRLGPRRRADADAANNGDAAQGNLESVRLPELAPQADADDPFSEFQRKMIGHLVRFDRDSADRVWREAYATFPAKDLCINLLQPVLVAVGEGWHRGQVSVAAEHFTTNYVEGKIAGFLSSYPDNPTGATIMTGCAQGETHQTGIMMLSLFLRWDGHKVIYLGQNVPNSTISDAVKEVKPNMVLLSATMKENAHALTEVGHILAQMAVPRPILGFGGFAFMFYPELRTQVQGHYLGDDPDTILKNVKSLLGVPTS